MLSSAAGTAAAPAFSPSRCTSIHPALVTHCLQQGQHLLYVDKAEKQKHASSAQKYPTASSCLALSTMPVTTGNLFAALADVAEDITHSFTGKEKGAQDAESLTATTSYSLAVSAANTLETTPPASESSAPDAKRQKIRNPLVWVDLEMTGLDVNQDTIIEVACIITDGELKHEVEGPDLVIHQSDEVLDNMNDWCKEHHGKSGLTAKVRASTTSMEEAEQQLMEFVKQYCHPGAAQLAGNSVHVDRMFLLKYMPDFANYLSYRIVDVSSIKELAKRWYPKAVLKAPRKASRHTALSDIKESIEELKYYQKAIFKNPQHVR